MLKRKFFAVALPLVAGATIVGSGFAAWVFGEQSFSAKGKNIGVQLTEEAGLDGVNLEFKFTGTKIGTHDGEDATQPILLQETDTIKLVKYLFAQEW